MDRKQRRGEYKETRVTNYFKVADKKFRLCYTPKNNQKRVSIQINNQLDKFTPFIIKIIKLGKYNTLKLYIHKNYIPDSYQEIQQFLEAIRIQGYDIRTSVSSSDISCSQETYHLLCIVEKVSVSEIVP